MIALALAVVLSQSDVYTWTDADGVVHYTDGASGVPDNAQKTEPDGPVTVLAREPKNLAEPLPEKPAPRPAAAPAPQPSRQQAAQPAVPPSRGGFTHTTNYPGLEGMDVYYRHDPWPAYGPYGAYGYGRPQGWAPAVQPPAPKANKEPELIVNTPAPKAPQPKAQGTKAAPAARR